MKVQPPFVGFPSPNVTLSVWHLFARAGHKFRHVAFMTMGWNLWNEPRGSYPVRGTHWDLFSHGYREEDLQRWSEFRAET